MSDGMIVTVRPVSHLSGRIQIPSSKSQTVRALFFALLAKGQSVIENALTSEDTRCAISVCRQFGALIHQEGDRLVIESTGWPCPSLVDPLNTGNSGITTLFTLPLLGLRQKPETPIVLQCGEQMRKRPVLPLIGALRDLGMSIQSIEHPDHLPVMVTGSLMGGHATVDGAHSQYLSALLISLPCAVRDSVITVHHLCERPYIEMTLSFLRQQAIDYRHEAHPGIDIFYIKGGQQYSPFKKRIAGDFSSASCVITASLLIPSDVELQGLDMDEPQGDKRLISIAEAMGAAIKIQHNAVSITGAPHSLRGIDIDASDIPDLVPALAVLGTQAIGRTRIRHVPHARIKETDRIVSMTQGLRKMGATIEEHPDGMTIYPSVLQGAEVEGFKDHRTVMALVVAGMIAAGETRITDGESIDKTYPTFLSDMNRLGSQIVSEAPQKHIILIGFKHVGKTDIGRKLADFLGKPFIDLDEAIEKTYTEQHKIDKTVREIMRCHGEGYYRTLESQVLSHVISSASSVIALGGGAICDSRNQAIISSHRILHIVAPQAMVFDRIRHAGYPAFCDSLDDPLKALSQLWDEREPVYRALTALRVENNTTIDDAVRAAMVHLNDD